MEYTTQQAVVSGFGLVDKVFVGGRWVGMVYRDPHPPAELAELWMVYTQGGHGTDSRESGIREFVEHAAANPDFELH